MVKALVVLIALLAMPVPMTLFLKSLHKEFEWAIGYICGVIVNLTVFNETIKCMASNYSTPSTMPIKLVLAEIVLVSILFITVVIIRCLKSKRWIGLRNIFYVEKKSFSLKGNVKVFKWQMKETLAIKCLSVLALLVCILCVYRSIAYLPLEGLRRLADVNRLDFFGFVNSDYCVMLGYYFNRLLGLSPYNVICVILPVTFVIVYMILCYCFANSFFPNDRLKVAFCFLIEAIMIFVGDCLYSHAYLVLHGMVDVTYVAIILIVPSIFLIGIRFYFYEGQLVIRTVQKVDNTIEESDEEIVRYKFNLPIYWIVLGIMLIAAYIIDEKAFVLSMINVVIFALLFVGRRYLPWLQSSKQ